MRNKTTRAAVDEIRMHAANGYRRMSTWLLAFMFGAVSGRAWLGDYTRHAVCCNECQIMHKFVLLFLSSLNFAYLIPHSDWLQR